MADLFSIEQEEIKVSVITVNGKKMTRNFVNQILEEDIYRIIRRKEPENSLTCELKIYGKPLGYVIVENPGQHRKELLLWVKDAELRKCRFRPVSFEDYQQGAITQGEYNSLLPIFNAPHLFSS